MSSSHRPPEDDTIKRSTFPDLRRSNQLEIIGGIAAGLGHDLGNVLNVVLGCANAVRARLHRDDPAREPIEQLCLAAERGRSMIDQIVRLVRSPETDAGHHATAPIVLDENITTSVWLVRALVGDRVNVGLDLRAGAALVPIERGELQRVLLNVASNARDAMPNGGTLLLATYVDEPSAVDGSDSGTPAKGRVVLEITDNGHGMDAETQARAFESFSRRSLKAPGRALGSRSFLTPSLVPVGTSAFAASPGTEQPCGSACPWSSLE